MLLLSDTFLVTQSGTRLSRASLVSRDASWLWQGKDDWGFWPGVCTGFVMDNKQFHTISVSIVTWILSKVMYCNQTLNYFDPNCHNFSRFNGVFSADSACFDGGHNGPKLQPNQSYLWPNRRSLCRWPDLHDHKYAVESFVWLLVKNYVSILFVSSFVFYYKATPLNNLGQACQSSPAASESVDGWVKMYFVF